MKKQIRNNVFETNSSSVHSISISGKGLRKNKMKIYPDGKIHVELNEFGKDLNFYSTQKMKLSYLCTLCWYENGMTVDDIEDCYHFQCLEEMIREYTGADGILITSEKKAGIDHQSVPEWGGNDVVNLNDKDDMKQFVFNSYISLKTDCD